MVPAHGEEQSLELLLPPLATILLRAGSMTGGSVPKPAGGALTRSVAKWDGLGVNFAVFSAHAERIDLCLFDPSGRREIARRDLPACTDQVWHGYLPDAGPGTVYGFRAHGPYHPAEGHRFNPYKLLLDPYARAIADGIRLVRCALRVSRELAAARSLVRSARQRRGRT